MYVCMYVCTYVYVYVCMYVCMYDRCKHIVTQLFHSQVLRRTGPVSVRSGNGRSRVQSRALHIKVVKMVLAAPRLALRITKQS